MELKAGDTKSDRVRDRVVELLRVKASSLKPNPRNWRTHPEPQRAALRGVLGEIGYADALLVRRLKGGALELIDGHLRASTTPDQEVPVLVLDLSAKEADQLLATLDPLAGMAGVDPVALEKLLAGLRFSDNAVRAMLERLASDSGLRANMPEDETPEPLPVAVSKPGDLWILGQHRLLCGSSLERADVARVMNGGKAALVATDPPYLVDYTGERPGKRGGNDGGKDWSGTYREIDVRDPEGFFRALFTRITDVLAEHAAIYCWHAHRRCGMIQRLWEELGLLDHQQIIWVKPVPVLGRVFWHHRHEPCIMGWKQGSMPAHDGRHDGNSVWEVAGDEMSVWYVDWEGKKRISGNEHPTQKPLELFARPMRKHTKPGDVVFEPFSGSGSQLIAAERLGRSCRAIELEPVFVDVAIRRWQNETGRDAVRESDEKIWASVARKKGVKA